MIDLTRRTHWVFDMDGTLTVPMHDFAAIKRELEIPDGEDILTELARRPPARAAADRAFLAAWEEDIARRAQAQDDALALLEALQDAGARLGVLTRNTRLGATLTLEASGLARFFADDEVLGRGCAPAKPHPGGVQVLLDRWGAQAEDAVVVGDWIYDIRAGAAAGAATVLVRRHGAQPWEGEADLTVDDLRMLLTAPAG